jgi:hypothetical protein
MAPPSIAAEGDPSWYTKRATLTQTVEAANAYQHPNTVQWGPWYLAGPFPNPDGKGFSTVYPPEAGVDMAATYEGIGGAKVQWQRKDAFVAGRTNDLLPHVQPNTNVTAYLTRSISCPEATQVNVLLGSDDTLTIWLNGTQLLAKNVARACQLGDDQVTLPLRKGENRLLLKVCQGQLGFAFAFEVAATGPTERIDLLRNLLWRDFPGQVGEWERGVLLGKATAVAVAGKALVPTAEEVPSHLLGCKIRLAPSFGRKELSFVGSGRVGAGGTDDGEWNHLIGPAYSSPDFIASERIRLQIGAGKARDLMVGMQRIAGSGVLFGRAEFDDLVAEVYEFAPWDGVEAIRLVHVHNRGATPVSEVRLTAQVRATGKPAIEDGVLAIYIDKGAGSYGGECPNWSPRVARITWSGADTGVEPGFVLRSGPLVLPPGGGATRALVHLVEWRADAKPLPAMNHGKADLEAALAEWKAWFARGDADLLAHPRLGLIFESQLAFMRMQQSYDGGLIAGVRRYAYSYIRDMHGAARGFLAAGHRDEVRREMEWVDRKYRKFKNIVNASEMGGDIRDFVGGHKGTELPAYYLLMARGFLARGGDPAVVERLRESLQHAADIQIEVSRKQGWRFTYNGDETERYVPTRDGETYDFSTPEWKKTTWSMPSHVLAMASVDFFARELAPRWKMDPTPYRTALAEWNKSFAPTFQPDGRRTPVWTVFSGGQLPPRPVPNYLCFAAWIQAPFPAEQRAAWTWDAAWSLREDGWLAVMPGRVEGTCGNSLALLLAALIQSGADRAVVDHAVNLILAGGMLQQYGLVNEFYGPKGTPNPHNLRPFETGPLLDALAQSVRMGVENRK